MGFPAFFVITIITIINWIFVGYEVYVYSQAKPNVI